MKCLRIERILLCIGACILLLLASCQPKPLGEEVFDLNDFSFGLSVHGLYENELKKENTKSYYSYSDTSFVRENGVRTAKAINYILDVEKPAQPIAKLKNISFNNVKSIATVGDKLMMISGGASCGFKDQLNLIAELKKEYGKPVVIQHISSFTTFTWRLKDRVIQVQCEMIPDYNNYEHRKGEFLNPDGGFLKSDSYEPNHVWKAYVYVYNEDYKKQLYDEISLLSDMNGLRPYLYDNTEKTINPF